MMLSYSMLLLDRQALSEHTTTSSFTKSLGQALRVSLVKPGAYLSESYDVGCWGPTSTTSQRLCTHKARLTQVLVVSLNARDEVLSAEYHKIRASQGTKILWLSSCPVIW